MSPAFLAALLALFAFPAVARAAPAFDVAVDPRFELLGVVSHLAGRGGSAAGAAAYRDEVERRFGGLRDHPAVRLYRDIAADPAREQSLATILIYYSPPPELKLKDPDADIHYLNGTGQSEEMQRFLWELRDFARVSGFPAFFREHRDLYRRLETSARGAFGKIDPLALIESYLGLSLSSRSHYILPLLSAGAHAFIVPYPLPPAAAGAKAFEVFTMSPELLSGFSDNVWSEPLSVFVDPSFHYFDKLRVPDPEKFYGPEIARCRSAAPDCAKHLVALAVIERLNKKAADAGIPFTADASSDAFHPRYAAALSERLEEYERRRDLYPTLWDFYPRLLGVFYELAFPGGAAPPAASSALRIRKVSDFFDPAITGAPDAGRAPAKAAAAAPSVSFEVDPLHAISPQAAAAYMGRTDGEHRSAADGLGSAEFQADLAEAVGLRVLALDLGEAAYRAALFRRPAERVARLEALGERLKEYEADRSRYPALEAFYPRLLERPAPPPLERAALAVRAGDRQAALGFLSEARKLNHDPASRQRMAMLHQEMKDYAGALSLLEPLAREHPADAALLADLGLCKFLDGRAEDAIADLQAAIKLDPVSLAAYVTLGSIHAGQKRFDLELQVYRSAPPSGGDPALRALLLRNLDTLGQKR